MLCTDCNGNRKDEEPKIRMVVFTSRNRQWHRWRHGLHAVDQVQPNDTYSAILLYVLDAGVLHLCTCPVEISNPATA